ncbi:carbohydrate ABC transporter substrate-binding protein [Vagococcus sp. BWB3-3]|uniref:Carbohydrate ABC transporter substrate-binding protein n=1 Tax=Vagococcus allomyrinae TaxID=2794353 RepID=A0A940SXE4_9ENTE|nr:ABC transporter substrate-binding protein [Vagococcus allomyrinae]MBP1044024.1 carbohydrate ABC transporter substrate-binding protein [Vagococcus allomyrinae]
MKRMKWLIGLSTALLCGALLTGCGTKKETNTDTDGKTKVTFWAAPNPTQLKYWEEMATEFGKSQSDIVVEVSQMKESPSSEATIQSAIASKTAPTLSENINRSFAAQLAASEAILPIDEQKGFDDIVKGRNMTKTIDSWQFSDGEQFVLPVYSNPILFAWNLELLKELGYNEPPKTYSELLEVGKKLKDKHPDKVMWAKKDLADPTAWMRWFDFFPLYNGASEGSSFVEANKVSADDQAVEDVLTLVSKLQKEDLLLTGESTDPFENSISLMADLGPWTFPNWAEKYPELTYGESYTIATPVVPDRLKAAETVSTYADAKGIVMYAQAGEKEQAAAMKFLKFVYGDETHDAKFLEVTSLIPARDDATENAAFKEYFEAHPEMAAYAENVPYAVPAMDNELYNDIQQTFGEQTWVPVIRGEKAPAKAWSEGKKAIEGVLP